MKFSPKNQTDMDYPTEEKHEKHFCLECGTAIPYGKRQDIKFCCPTCKNKYHNKRNTGPRNAKLRIAHILEKNYEILSEMLGLGDTAAQLSSLLVKGFNPMYSTCAYKQNRKDVRMCFDITYVVTSSRIYDLSYADEKTSGSY